MSIRNLDALFEPRAIAVVGASNRPRSVGHVVTRNLLRGGFQGPVMPVNPDQRAVAGVLAYPDVTQLPQPPDLAVVCTPPETVPELVARLGDAGARAVAVLTAGLALDTDEKGRSLVDRMLEAARPRRVRVLGPNCLGLLVPGIGLNASFAHVPAQPGKLAFLSQSGAFCTAALDWARDNGVGFSHFVSLGDSADVDVGDVLDYLATDHSTRAILLYLESIGAARHFMSAARAAARSKPVLIVKSGRVSEGARAARSHTGALAGSDAVYEAAFRRAGMLRVYEIDELFGAAETLGRTRGVPGDRLAIVTNGGGPGVMATDTLVAGGGRLAELSPETLERLDAALPSTWSRANPVDLIGDAPGERYAKALEAVAADEGVDAVLVMNAPTAIASSEEAAEALAAALRGMRRRPHLLACWMGRSDAARRTLRDAGIPTYDSPADAVRAFLHMMHYRRNQELLTETPASLPEEFVPRTEAARAVIDAALAQGRSMLTEPEAKSVLEAYGVDTVPTRVAATPEAAAELAAPLGFPVAVKILSRDVTHKSDVGGVALDLGSEEAVRDAAQAMTQRLHDLVPDARHDGFTVQPMARRPGAVELILGATTDPVFGPVLLFGRGGTATEVIGDRAIGFPPLNENLARALVGRTRVSRRLMGYREQPAADLAALTRVLIAVSHIVTDLPEVVELDVNPLLADEKGVVALDARIAIEPCEAAGPERLAIRPYPQGLEDRYTMKDGREVLLRPIRPEDEPAHRDFLSRLSPEDMRFRFFGVVREMTHADLARFTQIDYDREMAFIATIPGAAGGSETLGVVRAVADPDNQEAEYAIVVRTDLKGQGLGRALMEKIIRYLRQRGTREVVGTVLPENRAMLELVRRMGFRSHRLGDAVEVRLPLVSRG